MESSTATADPVSPRDRKRTRVLMVATLFTATGAHRIRIRDLSPSGLQIASDSQIALGSDVIFKRGALFRAGWIAWSEDRQAGLSFYRELTPAELDSTLHAIVSDAA